MARLTDETYSDAGNWRSLTAYIISDLDNVPRPALWLGGGNDGNNNKILERIIVLEKEVGILKDDMKEVKADLKQLNTRVGTIAVSLNVNAKITWALFASILIAIVAGKFL